MRARAGSRRVAAARCRQSASLTAHRLAAWRRNVVRAVDLPQAREQVAEVAPEVGVQALVGVEAEELADDLGREHLAVGEDRRRAALPQPAIVAEVADEIVHEAENGDDEGLQVHGRPSLRRIRREERLGATGTPLTTLLLKNPHTGLATVLSFFTHTSLRRSYG